MITIVEPLALAVALPEDYHPLQHNKESTKKDDMMFTEVVKGTLFLRLITILFISCDCRKNLALITFFAL